MNEVNDARQNETNTADLLATESTDFKVEMTVKNLKIYKSRSVNQIPAKLTKARCRTVISKTYKCINSVWIKGKCLNCRWSHFTYLQER